MSFADAGLDDFFAGSDALYDALPEGVRVMFDLSGRQGGLWTVHRREGGGIEVSRAAVRRPDCHLICSVDDFIALVEGTLTARDAFMAGRIEVTGDVGLVWRLQKILVARKGA
jgi:putative sterol carrier protein